MNYIPRAISPAILRATEYFSVIVITGPRQTGKTTLSHQLFPDFKEYNFEDVALREAVSNDPKAFLRDCGDRVLIDEVQRVSDIFSYIQLAVDSQPERKFVLTGSNNFTLMESITQSLAGRASLFTLLPFSLDEVDDYKRTPTNELMLNGFYPGVVAKGMPVDLFFPNYYTTYIERDVLQLKSLTDLASFQKFIRLLAGRVGSVFNASSFTNELGISSPTVKSWLSVLQTSYIAFTLEPYIANISKRLVKMPKVYFYDTGLLCFLLGITTAEQLAVHPLRGAIFENLVLVEKLKRRVNAGEFAHFYYYRDSNGVEIDIVEERELALHLTEVKSSATYTPDFLKNIKKVSAVAGLRVGSSQVVYDGDTIPGIATNFREI